MQIAKRRKFFGPGTSQALFRGPRRISPAQTLGIAFLAELIPGEYALADAAQCCLLAALAIHPLLEAALGGTEHTRLHTGAEEEASEGHALTRVEHPALRLGKL